jgi:hypothetical protein
MKKTSFETWQLFLLIIFGLSIFACGNGSNGRGGEDDGDGVSSNNIISWEATFGGSANDFATSVQQTADSGYIVVGSTWSYGAGQVDIYLVKTDMNSNVVWERTFGGSDNDYGHSVRQTADGGYIIIGETWSFGAGEIDVYLIKTDENGAVVWEKTFGGSDSDLGFSVFNTPSGDFIIVGETQSYGAGQQDVYLIKTDENGVVIWEKTFGGSDNDLGYSVQQTTDRGYIIAGITSSYGSGAYDVYLIKTDENGNGIWEKTFGGTIYDYGTSVEQISDGGYIITGWKQSVGTSYFDVYLIKADANGNVIWEKTFGGSDTDLGLSVQQTTDKGYIIAGITSSYGSGSSDVYLIKTNENGDKVWERVLGGSLGEEGRSVQQTSDGGYIVTGWKQSYGSTSYADVLLMKTDKDGNIQ